MEDGKASGRENIEDEKMRRTWDIMSCTLVTIQCMYNIRQSLFYFTFFIFEEICRSI